MGVPALSLFICHDAEYEGSAAIRALLLDDDVVDRQMFRRAVEKCGMRIDLSEVSSLDEFRVAIEAETYHVAFIDLKLGRGSGLDALDLIVAEERPTVTVMISGQDDPNLAAAAFRRGCADYVEKAELSPNVLRRAVTEALEGRRHGGTFASI